MQSRLSGEIALPPNDVFFVYFSHCLLPRADLKLLLSRVTMLFTIFISGRMKWASFSKRPNSRGNRFSTMLDKAMISGVCDYTVSFCNMYSFLAQPSLDQSLARRLVGSGIYVSFLTKPPLWTVDNS